ncbi:metallothionein [Hydrocoleum sp. CS-953]|uniref:metallothionein n=1 Tax=Hydrocoleum sp. CS-953 TaxID=1671698 RepID=UPI000B9C149D|nr:metallothionein [Hydrocoleum sp. CS-953]
MTTVTQMKCACESCLCIVSIESAVKKNGQNYCSEACANNHPDGAGCGHEGCECNS